jgi:transcriptional regulator with XRE-family HTH domain|nr:MAG TPA: Repressor protein CI [Caudoviricetes sp.]
MAKLGENIKKNRIRLKMTQADLADALGVFSTTVSAWEVGRNKPLIDKIEMMAQIFNVKKSELLGETLEDTTPELTKRDEQNIQKDIETLIQQLDDGLYSKDTAEYDEETRQLLIASLEQAARIAKLAAKEKFTPKKYKQ